MQFLKMFHQPLEQQLHQAQKSQRLVILLQVNVTKGIFITFNVPWCIFQEMPFKGKKHFTVLLLIFHIIYHYEH